MDEFVLTANERYFIADTLKDALVEVEELDGVSQGVIDKLVSSLQILGESYE